MQRKMWGTHIHTERDRDTQTHGETGSQRYTETGSKERPGKTDPEEQAADCI